MEQYLLCLMVIIN